MLRGVMAGFARGGADIVDQLYRQGPFSGASAWNAAGDRISPDDSGLTGGARAGCDLSVGSNAFVVGVVGDFAFTNIAGSAASSLSADTRASFDVNWTGTLRARAGAVHQGALFYLTGGGALADTSISAVDASTAPSPGLMSVTDGGVRVGWAIGGGVEWQVAPRMTFGIEYLHMQFPGLEASGQSSNIIGAFPRFKGDPSVDVVRFSLNWRL